MELLLFYLFGKRWVLFNMKQGVKAAIFATRVEIEMVKSKILGYEAEIKQIDDDLSSGKYTKEQLSDVMKHKDFIKDKLDNPRIGLNVSLGAKYDKLNDEKFKLEFLKTYKP